MSAHTDMDACLVVGARKEGHFILLRFERHIFSNIICVGGRDLLFFVVLIISCLLARCCVVAGHSDFDVGDSLSSF